jgi:putative SOS response-associated peptidase YedK
MCGRYTLTNPDPKRLKLRFGIDAPFEFDERPRFNIAPTDSVLAVRSQDDTRELGKLRWGLMPGRWAEKPGRPLINARAETVATQPAYSESFRERRCLIPADGFYEWKKLPTGKQPMWISRPDEDLFAFAGIWASLERSDGETVHSCSIVTCEPNEMMREIHDRMPAILDPDVESTWLDPDADPDVLLGLLGPAAPGLLVAREVGEGVNDVRKDGPELLEPPLKLF